MTMVSKETARLFLYVPLAIALIGVVVAALLFFLRNISTRAIMKLNLVLASVALLISILALTGARWAGSQPHIPYHTTVRGVAMDLVVLIWFSGAVELFSRKRLAWIGSMIGAGASVYAFVAILGTFTWLYLYPDEKMNEAKEIRAGVYIFTLIFGLTQFSVMLAIVLKLFIGLFRARRELSSGSYKDES